MIRLSKYFNVVILLTFLAILLFWARFANNTVQSSSLDGNLMSQPTVLATSPSVPLMFIENVGQFDEGARFQVRGSTSTMWLAEDALWITMFKPEDVSEPEQPLDRLRVRTPPRGIAPTGEPANRQPRRAVNLKLSFVGANPDPEIEPFDRLETYFNYFRGNDPDKWRSHVPTWGGVRYKEIYPGIDLELTSENGHGVQRLVAHSGANLDAVRLRVDGADEVKLLTASQRSSLFPVGEGLDVRGVSANTAIGDVTLPLFALVSPDGIPLDITSAPTVNANQIHAPFAPSVRTTTTRHQLDPTLAYSTFIGGNGDDDGDSLAVTAAGEAIVTGESDSTDFPTTVGVNDSSDDFFDLFVSKLSADGTTLVYSTLIGGSDDNFGNELALTVAGEAIVTGSTYSEDFPTTPNAYDSSHNGGTDGFVFKLSADGTTLIYSTFIGGASRDSGSSLALTAAGEAVVTGSTQSEDFPNVNAYDSSFDGDWDMFVFKLSADGRTLTYSTFIGGSEYDQGKSLALTTAGEAIVTGYTLSPDFPTSTNAYDSSYNGASEGFVLKLSADGATLVYSTFIGGSRHDNGESLALTAVGEAIVTGVTFSEDFPTSTNAYDSSYNGEEDIFVLKLSVDGETLAYSTFIGGRFYETGNSLALTAAGEVLVAGKTSSVSFPTSANAYDSSYNGSVDLFVLKLSADYETLAYSTFIGGSNREEAYSLALTAADKVLLTGKTESLNFPTSTNAYDSSHNGFSDLFVLRLDGLESLPVPSPTNTPVSAAYHLYLPLIIGE